MAILSLLWLFCCLDHALPLCRQVEQVPQSSRTPLHGIPFAVKDNCDISAWPTTAACPTFEYTPQETAPAVQALLDAGEPLITAHLSLA